jgi:protein disulfide-isomerase
MENKLKIQIWSDIMCPYCYIGKRKLTLSNNLSTNCRRNRWKSFQLDASFVASEDDDMVEHLATKIPKDKQWAQEMMDMTKTQKFRIGFSF